MLAVALGELAILAALALAFIVVHARGPWRSTAAGRQLMLMPVAILTLAVGLFLLSVGLGPPMWVWVLILGATVVMMARWLLLLWRARKVADRGQPSSSADGPV